MKFMAKLLLGTSTDVSDSLSGAPSRPRIFAVLICLLTLPVCMIAARIPAENALVSLTVNSTAKGPIMSITNNGNSPITGFIVTLDTLNNPNKLTKYYYDIYCNYGADHEVPKGASVDMPLPYNGPASSAVPLATPIFQAALFKDGTTSGDPRWINDLVKRRSILSLRLKEAIDLLQNASDRQISKQDTVARLQLRRDELAQENSDLPIESRRLHDKVIRMMMKNLSGDLTMAQLAKYLVVWQAFLQSARPVVAASSGPSQPAYETVLAGLPGEKNGVTLVALFK